MTCSSCSGASPAMPDRARRRSRISLARPLLTAILVLMAAGQAALASTPAGRGVTAGADRVAALAPPAETCRPDETVSAGGFSDICGAPPAGGGGGGGLDIGSLLPILGVVAVGGLILLIAALVVLRRTSAPLVPADPGEWWTCRTCGKNNVLGSARCYACGAWQR